MVAFKKRLLLLNLLAVCFLSSCNNDFFGLFGSTPLEERLIERNNFKFLRPKDMTISLGNEYSFIVLADIHIDKGDSHNFEKLKEIISADKKIKFVVITGDITQNGDRADFEKFIQIARSFEIPCFPVIGNHDIYFGNWPNWKELIGSTCYKIDGGTAALFFLDSANAYFGKEQLDWLEKEIKSTDGKVFVFSHCNLFVKNPVNLMQFTDTKERVRVCSILHGSAGIMFMGHAHNRIIDEVGRFQYISIEDFRSTGVYCRVSVNENSISYQFEKI